MFWFIVAMIFAAYVIYSLVEIKERLRLITEHLGIKTGEEIILVRDEEVNKRFDK